MSQWIKSIETNKKILKYISETQLWIKSIETNKKILKYISETQLFPLNQRVKLMKKTGLVFSF